MLHAFHELPVLKSVNGWAARGAWASPTPGLPPLLDRRAPGASYEARPDGTARQLHPARYHVRYHVRGLARLAPLIFFVSMTKIKGQEGYMNDNLELCPNTEATIWATSSITLSPKARKEKGQLCLSTASLAQPLPATPLLCFLNHHSHINQLVQGFEIS